MPVNAKDVVIIGAGHNGLVAANYLARAGLKVLVLERRSIVGGACVTEELIPGFKSSSCAFVAGALRPQIIRDLELKRFGLETYQDDDVLACSIALDGNHFFVWKEVDRTLREFSQSFGREDAEAFVQFGMRLQKIAGILEPTLLSPPLPVSEMVRIFEDSGNSNLFNEFICLSIKDLLDRYFKSDLLKGFLAFVAIVSIFGGPRTPGTAYGFTHHSTNDFEGRFGQWGFARGGMGNITEAMANGARNFGADIRTDAQVDRVIVEGGKARGVVLHGGEEIRAGVVMSNADPKHTYLGLVEPKYLPGEFVEQVRDLDFRGSMARVHVASNVLPHYVGFDSAEAGPQHRGHTMLGADVERFEMAWDAEKYGRLPDELMIEVIIQTVHDPEMAPPGKHLINTGIQQLPIDLADGTWDDIKEEFTQRVVETLCQYAPNLKGNIIGTHTITPLDLEREYGLTGGNIFHGSMFLNQLFGSRPVPGWSDYRAPVEGLYLCGVGMHPGGAVNGAAGHNAAKVVLKDLGMADHDPDSAAAEPKRASAHTSQYMSAMEQAYSHPVMRRVGLTLAKQRWTRPLSRFLTRGRSS
jgi:phytoene dehydrogenase-like protein